MKQIYVYIYERYLEKFEFNSELESFKERVYDIEQNFKKTTLFENLNLIYKIINYEMHIRVYQLFIKYTLRRI